MVVSEGLMEEVTSEQRPEGDNGENHAGMWGEVSFGLREQPVQRPWGRTIPDLLGEASVAGAA